MHNRTVGYRTQAAKTKVTTHGTRLLTFFITRSIIFGVFFIRHKKQKQRNLAKAEKRQDEIQQETERGINTSPIFWALWPGNQCCRSLTLVPTEPVLLFSSLTFKMPTKKKQFFPRFFCFFLFEVPVPYIYIIFQR